MARAPSVADDLRADDRELLSRLSAAERVRLALDLGRRDLEIFRLAQHLPLAREVAARLLERRRQDGRQRSDCLRALSA